MKRTILFLACTALALGAFAEGAPSGALVDGQAFIPLSTVIDWLGATKTYDAGTKAITITIPQRNLDPVLSDNPMVIPRYTPEKVVVLKLHSADITVDGVADQMNGQMVVGKGNVGLIPVRGFLEAVNKGVSLQLRANFVKANMKVVLSQPQDKVHRQLDIPVAVADLLSGKAPSA